MRVWMDRLRDSLSRQVKYVPHDMAGGRRSRHAIGIVMGLAAPRLTHHHRWGMGEEGGRGGGAASTTGAGPRTVTVSVHGSAGFRGATSR